MKKNLFLGFIACATLAMTGCTNDGVVAEGAKTQPAAIEFGTYLGRDVQTRGTVMNNDALKNMGVYASYTANKDFDGTTAPNFMYNQEVTKNSSIWSYTPVKYWPSTQNDKVSFFAYAPFGTEANGISTSSQNNTTGAPSVTVEIKGAKDMVDFVAGVQMNKSFDNGASANNTVAFSLQHEMSRVGISAKLDKEVYSDEASKKTFVVIKDVQIDKVGDEGQFYNKATYTFSTTTGTRGTWDFANATKSNADWNLADILNKTPITAEGAKSGVYKTGVDGIKLTNGTAVPLFKETDFLFLIPASDNKGTGLTGGKATATISYDIVTEDSKLERGYSLTSATKTVNLPAGTLQQGVAYTYTFVIKLNEVVLSATVNDWSEATNSDIDIPYNANK